MSSSTATATASSEAIKGAVTLTRFLIASQQSHADASGDFTLLMSSIQLACKVIASSVRKAGISGLYGLQGEVNVQGEEVKKLDIISHDTFVASCVSSTKCAVLVSEEIPDAIIVDKKQRGKYCVVFDPLDGSSNIDCNVAVGSIFGIYARSEENLAKDPSIEDVLQPGNTLVCAGYCMYGSATQLVLTWGEGVNVFTYDSSCGEFILTGANVKIPEKSQTIYSVNEGNSCYWSADIKNFVDHIKFKLSKPYSARYIGSMVADVHRTLLYGGIFMYPADSKSTSGKLRLLYEANPMSFIMEQAGGLSICGKGKRVMDIQPKSIHERTPIFLGTKRDIELLQTFMQ